MMPTEHLRPGQLEPSPARRYSLHRPHIFHESSHFMMELFTGATAGYSLIPGAINSLREGQISLSITQAIIAAVIVSADWCLHQDLLEKLFRRDRPRS